MKPLIFIVLLITGFASVCGVVAQMPEAKPGSVNDVMQNIITPATNTIWGIEEPQTDEDWQVYIDAAEQVIDAATRIKVGGTGENDPNWAKDPEWRRFADQLIESGRQIGEAARQRDLERLIDVSNEMMYPPCEECHLEFHPGMQEQEYN
ncbi:MAG: hypothetical protein R3192_11890 [Woeseiaceae bacterium]|nr:hypothetical protein [Woeseiaceae bacterium]